MQIVFANEVQVQAVFELALFRVLLIELMCFKLAPPLDIQACETIEKTIKVMQLWAQTVDVNQNNLATLCEDRGRSCRDGI